VLLKKATNIYILTFNQNQNLKKKNTVHNFQTLAQQKDKCPSFR